MDSAMKRGTYRWALATLMESASRDMDGGGMGFRSTDDRWREEVSLAWRIVFRRVYGREPDASECRNARMESPRSQTVAGTLDDICGLCGEPGADKVPHAIRWPGERAPETPFVHIECERGECARAHALLSDAQRRAFLRRVHA